jgi:hypothetical protein
METETPVVTRSDAFLVEMRESMASLAPLIRRLSVGCEKVATAIGASQTWSDLENRLRLLGATVSIAQQVAGMANFMVTSPDVLDGKLAETLTPPEESKVVTP